MARAKAKEATEAPVADVMDVLRLLDASRIVEDANKKFKMAGATLDVKARRSTAISTGLLATDLLLNGGIYPGGMYTFFGPEQSAKSTHMMTGLAAFFYSDVPLIYYADAEGSTTPEYIEAIARASNVKREIDIKKVFGIRDPKTGSWVVEPRIRYSPENSLEGIWKTFAAILRRFPDKVYDSDTDKWWLLFDNTKENISRFKGVHDTKIGKAYGKIAIESLDGGRAQALFVVDSYASMISEADDDEDDKGTNALGLEARGHSKQLKKVKGRLKRKHCTLIGTNQLRDKPMAKDWEPKDYEPGGNALRFYSDARIRQTPRSVPHDKGQIEMEASVIESAGEDTYRYICMRAIKNKFGAPYLESWYRIWVSDPRGVGHGFCPVYDTYYYLKNTGQLDGNIGGKKGISIALDDLELDGLGWLDFKALILLQGKPLQKLCAKLGIEKNPRIRERCFDQIRSGEGVDLFFANLHGLDQGSGIGAHEIHALDEAGLVAFLKEHKLAKVAEIKAMKPKKMLKLALTIADESVEPEEAEVEVKPKSKKGTKEVEIDTTAKPAKGKKAAAANDDAEPDEEAPAPKRGKKAA